MDSPDDLLDERPEKPRGGESCDNGNEKRGDVRGIKNAGGNEEGGGGDYGNERDDIQPRRTRGFEQSGSGTGNSPGKGANSPPTHTTAAVTNVPTTEDGATGWFDNE
jgi:hypothetical protein